LVFGAVAGCGAVLGIPSDIERAPPSPQEPPTDAPTSDDQPSPDVTDGGAGDGDAATHPDTYVPPPECDPLKDFGTPQLVMSVSSTEAEGSPKLSDDELTIYFDALRSANSAYYDLYTAKRAKKTDVFGTPSLIQGGVNTTNNHEFAPNVSPLGTRIFFERKDVNTLVDTFMTATRANDTLPWQTASLISGVNFPAYQTKLDVRGEGDELYFTAKGTGTKFHLYIAKLSGGNYVTTQLAELGNTSSAGEEFSTAVSKDGLTIYFSSTRTPTMGGEDVWVSHRADTNAVWGTPAQVMPLDSALDEEPSWLSNDGCRLYLQSNRPGSIGSQNIWVATKPF
jgi:hypothetical protein